MFAYTAAIEWVLWAAIAILLIVSGVWGLMLIGAWAANLQAPGHLKHIALNKDLADKVMGTLRRELLLVIAAVGLLFVSTIKSISISADVETVALSILSKVRTVPISKDLVGSLEILSQLPSDYKPTLEAYVIYLNKPDNPNKQLIETQLPQESDRTVYDLRLLGMVNDALAEQMPVPVSLKQKEKYLSEAHKFYTQALELLKGDAAEKIRPELLADLIQTMNADIVGVEMGMAELILDEKARKGALDKVKEKYIKLRNEWGKSPGVHLNLMAVLSLLGDYDEAISVLSSIRQDTRLSQSDKNFVLVYANNLERMHEFRPLVEHVKKNKKKDWADFVNQEMNPTPIESLTKQ